MACPTEPPAALRRREKMNPIFALVARLLLGALWLIAGSRKILQRASLSAHFEAFGLPRLAARVVAATLPCVEMGLGVLLLLGGWVTAAAGFSVLLLSLFSIAIIANLMRGRMVECHCFGELGRGTISWLSVLRNLALILVALVDYRSPFQALSVDRWGKGQLPPHFVPLDTVPVVLISLAAGMVCLLFASAWHVAEVIAQTENGPSSGMREHALLRPSRTASQKRRS
jgi:uncharacterized membrane protein YphA (DoxX/SURF4 family)